MMTISSSAIFLLAFASPLFAYGAARPAISRFIGIEYPGKAPDGIKFEAAVGLSEGRLIGDARFKLNRGQLDAHMVLWTHERADHGLHSESKVIDIIELPKPPVDEAFMDRCYFAKSNNVYASGIMGIAGKKGTIKAWGIDPTTGHIVSLNPKQVECESDDDTGD